MSRGKKPRGPKEKESAGGRWRSVAAVLLTLGAVAGLLLGLGRLGDEALRRLGPRDRYRVRFADVRCDPPAGIDRPTFLSEVRYVSNFPETFNALDPADRDRLSAAFAMHPWVDAVEGVTVEPPTVVRVRLRFRTPALAVQGDDGTTRLVDGTGVLLPEAGVSPGLPELATPVPAPPTPAGQVWADDTVKRAVELAKAYRPARLERTPKGWRLTQPDGKVLYVER